MVQTGVKQQQLSPASERDKLLPVLEAMTQHQEKKVENLKEKISTKQNKISKNQTKVAALTEKSTRLRQNNAILRTMSKNSTFPAIRHFIERKIDKNESRIAKIENEKIPGRKEKIAKHTKSVDKLQSKLNRSYSKIRHNTHLSNLISSFGVINRAERHERFMDALVDLTQMLLTEQLLKPINAQSRLKSSLSVITRQLLQPRNLALTRNYSSLKLNKQHYQIRLTGCTMHTAVISIFSIIRTSKAPISSSKTVLRLSTKQFIQIKQPLPI